ncbi:MAG: quinone oxidoreductase [Phyllobacteriaceae bacterium]|nr:quinone oxidoreductase [Phyllobacteriaceae bacterium]
MTDTFAIVATKPGGTDVLEWRQISLPAPGPGEVLILNTAIGVNFIDVYFRTGAYPWPSDGPLVLGQESAGVVEALGQGVTGFRRGDRVATVVRHGAYATHRIVPAAMLVKLPKTVSDAQAAASMLKGLTASYLIHSSYAVKAGDTVLFHAAAGGVGLIAGQWLASKGVTVIGTAGGPDKCALALKNGYHHMIDYRSEDFVARVMELTGGKGVEAVYDSVGADTYPGSLKVLKPLGTFVSFGQSSGPATGFKLADLAAGAYRATRPTLFVYLADRSWLERASRQMFRLIGNGTLKLSVDTSFTLKDAGAAHDALEGRKTTGSLVLMP